MTGMIPPGQVEEAQPSTPVSLPSQPPQVTECLLPGQGHQVPSAPSAVEATEDLLQVPPLGPTCGYCHERTGIPSLSRRVESARRGRVCHVCAVPLYEASA